MHFTLQERSLRSFSHVWSAMPLVSPRRTRSPRHILSAPLSVSQRTRSRCTLGQSSARLVIPNPLRYRIAYVVDSLGTLFPPHSLLGRRPSGTLLSNIIHMPRLEDLRYAAYR